MENHLPKDKYILEPCMGYAKENIEAGHVYGVKNPEGIEVGYMTLEQATERFGGENIFIFNSHGPCPECFEKHKRDIRAMKKSENSQISQQPSNSQAQ